MRLSLYAYVGSLLIQTHLTNFHENSYEYYVIEVFPNNPKLQIQ
jgi:hypothetical protein